MRPDKSLKHSKEPIELMAGRSCTEKSSFNPCHLDALCKEYHF